MIETPFSPSTSSRPLGRAPASMHAGLGPAVLVRRRERLPHADERINNLPLARPLRFPDDPAPARGTMRRAKEQVADLGARLAPRIRIGFPLLVGIQPFKILVRILQRVSRFRATGLGEALGRPETDGPLMNAMTSLGNGLNAAKHFEDALSVQEAELSMLRRLGDSEDNILFVQGNLASTYQRLGRCEEAMLLRRDVYSGNLKLVGAEHFDTLREAHNYAMSLLV